MALNSFKCEDLKFWIFLSYLLFICFGCGGGGGSDGSQPRHFIQGQAILGPLVNADVTVFRYTDLEKPVYMTKTSDAKDLEEAGLFDIPSERIENDGLYIIQVTGGMDIDKDDDGVLDDHPTANLGILHLLGPGSELNKGGIKANILTEILYQSYFYMIHARYPEKDIIDHLVRYADYLLREDFNGNGKVDFADLFLWNPVTDRDCLSRPWHLFAGYSNAILNNTSFYDKLEKITNPVLGYFHACSNWDSDPCLSSFEAVAVDGNYAYTIGGYSGLQVIDISQTESPVRIARSDAEAWPLGLAVVDSHVVIAAVNGLLIYNVGRPETPILETILPQKELTGIFISGTYAYGSAFKGGLFIFDISDLKSPKIISRLDLPGQGNGVALSGTNALIASGPAGLQIVDVKNPSMPVLIHHHETPGDAIAVAVKEKYAYIAMGESGVQIIDLQDVSSPRAVARIRADGFTSHITIKDDEAYVSGSVLQIYDIRDPADPVLLKRIRTNGGYLKETAVFDDRIVAVDGSGLAVIDKHATPSFEYIVGSCAEDVNPWRVYAHEDLLLSFKGIFSPSEKNMTLQLYGISNPETPKLLKEYEISGDDGRAAFWGNYIYVPGQGNRMTVLNSRVQGAPVVVGTFETTAASTTDMVITDGYGYLSGGSDGLVVLDLTKPEIPRPVGRLEMLGWAAKLCVAEKYLYLMTTGPERLNVIDIRNPAEPVLFNAIPFVARDFGVSGHHLYGIAEKTGLMIYDISEPGSPRHVSTFPLVFAARALTISGHYVYVADGRDGVVVIDIRDPVAPVKICRIGMPYAEDIAIAGDHAYIANFNGVKVVKVIAR